MVKFAIKDVYFSYVEKTSYNAVLWTMSYELIGSALLFLFLFVLGRGSAQLIGALAIIGNLITHLRPQSAAMA